MRRRPLLLAGLALPLGAAAKDETGVELLRAGAVVVAFRHALAPGTFDPPEFRLGDCRTQRNLNDEGRAQAKRLGQWFRHHQLQPTAVRSSPWCRCMDTATLAFGRAEAWPALGSPRGTTPEAYPAQLQALHRRLGEIAATPGRFEVWVSHNFVLRDLADAGTTSGEGLVMRPGADGKAEVLARITGI